MENVKPINLTEISEDEKKLVNDQLEIILASTFFHSAKQMKRFLEFIVRKTLKGEGKFLKQYTIGVEALDFPNDFDSDSNPSIRILAGRVRKRLTDYYESFPDSNIYITIPKGIYTPEFYSLANEKN